MNRCCRGDVLEADAEFVLVDYAGRDFAGDDFFKDGGVFHGGYLVDLERLYNL